MYVQLFGELGERRKTQVKINFKVSCVIKSANSFLIKKAILLSSSVITRNLRRRKKKSAHRNLLHGGEKCSQGTGKYEFTGEQPDMPPSYLYPEVVQSGKGGLFGDDG